MITEYLQIGAVGVIFIIFIKEFFSSRNKFDKKIFDELKTMNNNHLTHLTDAVLDGNNRILDTLHKNNIETIKSLNKISNAIQKNTKLLKNHLK